MDIQIHPPTRQRFGDALPAVFRYMDERYIDAFFTDGTLRLTTYELCKSLEDPATRDEDEGKQRFAITNGQQMVAVSQGVGLRTYLLCTSLSPTIAHFRTKNCFRIIEPIGFAKALAEAVQATQVQIGACTYDWPHREPTYSRSGPLLPMIDPSIITDPEATIKMFQDHMANLVHTTHGSATYFAKPDPPFGPDQEFRFVFTVDQDVIGPITIRCPAALPHCTRFP
jgi:hypothetical protein